MRYLSKIFVSVLLLTLVVSCGRDNLAKGDLTPDEKARAALEHGDYTTAIETLEDLIASDPENYQRYALLGAAYAARAGLAILDIVKAQFSSGGGGGDSSSLLGQVGSFLPADATSDNLADMRASLDRLNAIPEAERTAESDNAYGSSAAFQITLYSAAYSVMYLQKFTLPDGSGDFDPNRLATMTDADVDAILGALRASAASGTGVGADMGGAVDEALAEIDSQPGGTTREKLINYLNTTNGGTGG